MLNLPFLETKWLVRIALLCNTQLWTDYISSLISLLYTLHTKVTYVWFPSHYLRVSSQSQTSQQYIYIHKLCKILLKTKEDQGILTVTDFAPQSPDLNLIEHL